MRVALLAALLVLAACGSDLAGAPWDGTGVVTARRYDDPDDWTTTSQSCAAYDDKGECTFHVTNTQHHHDGPHWYAQVTTEDGEEHAVEMAEADWNHCRLGSLVTARRCPA